ncbi:type I 3-dehydroquinate dehydratase [Haloferula chungangensis]|uniref:3-dehydroquinate dehydratase n=1 Tax=Haloferula chungangensis TaxID=1048331 RepID=A0ABW2L5Y3_9BACT
MPRVPFVLQPGVPLVVGSFGDSKSLASIPLDLVHSSCDLVEIRLDLLDSESISSEDRPWHRFAGMPLLFTARRASEGGAGELDAEARMAMIRSVIEDASLVDIEVASISEMQPVIDDLKKAGVPWIGSFHDFFQVPATDLLSAKRMAARNAGAAAFKAAVELGWEMDQLAPLARFVQKSSDYPVSLMGMGPLAPVSRVLFAQLGSVLNYGYLGDTPTAPGQWSAKQLKEAIEGSRKA